MRFIFHPGVGFLVVSSVLRTPSTSSKECMSKPQPVQHVVAGRFVCPPLKEGQATTNNEIIVQV
jgi:hypothetical protein